MKSILVPTDFSNASKNAADYALNLAKAFNSSIILFHVYTLPVPVSTGAPIAVFTNDELQEINEVHLRKEASRLSEKSGVNITFKARMGPVVSEILDAEKNASMIIMGMKGASMLSETIMGSITTATMRRSIKPLLVIPENISYKAPEKIVFASDYKPVSKPKILAGLEIFMKKFNSKLYILNISKKYDVDNVEEETKRILSVETADNEAIYYFKENEDPVNGVNDFVKEKNADMLVIVPHHYKLFEGLFHKSISKKLAFHTLVPLLALPE